MVIEFCRPVGSPGVIPGIVSYALFGAFFPAIFMVLVGTVFVVALLARCPYI
jgi:hypothetical protein